MIEKETNNTCRIVSEIEYLLNKGNYEKLKKKCYYYLKKVRSTDDILFFDLIIDLESKVALAEYELGNYNVALQRLEDIIDLTADITDISETDNQRFLNGIRERMADCYYKLGEIDNAVSCYSKNIVILNEFAEQNCIVEKDYYEYVSYVQALSLLKPDEKNWIVKLYIDMDDFFQRYPLKKEKHAYWFLMIQIKEQIASRLPMNSHFDYIAHYLDEAINIIENIDVFDSILFKEMHAQLYTKKGILFSKPQGNPVDAIHCFGMSKDIFSKVSDDVLNPISIHKQHINDMLMAQLLRQITGDKSLAKEAYTDAISLGERLLENHEDYKVLGLIDCVNAYAQRGLFLKTISDLKHSLSLMEFLEEESPGYIEKNPEIKKQRKDVISFISECGECLTML